MPTKARKYCKTPQCGNYAITDGYCEQHYALKQQSGRRQYKSYEKWYSLAIWSKIKVRAIKRQPLCEKCKEAGKIVIATDVDHIVPHKGNWTLFTDENNLQSLCKSCHSSKTLQENGGRGYKNFFGKS